MPAIPLPNGKTQFVDINGAPLVGGTVEHYIPGGLTPKDTYENYDATILNANPLTLDARGQAVIFGTGQYRQIVKDSLGNTIWDTDTVGYLPTPVAYLYLAFSFASDSPPVADAFLGGWAIPAAATFPAGMADPDSQFHANINANATYVISILKNGVQVATLTINNDGTYAYATVGGTAWSVAAGDRVTIVGQHATDTTLNDFFGTLAGTFA